MPENLSISNLLRYAFITSPFFGLFGAIPGFALREFEWQHTSNIFIFITSITLLFWCSNIFLFRMSTRKQWLKKNIVRIMVSSVICSMLVFTVFNLLPSIPPPENWKRLSLPGQQNHHLFVLPLTQLLASNCVIFILLELIVLKKTTDKVAYENEQLKLSNLEARNNQLQQQLHPHFLFNSLSTLRSLIHRSPEAAENYLEQLAELLRYSTNNSNQTVVSLKEEIELCTNYLNMQRVRFSSALYFSIDIGQGKQPQGKLPVYALQLLAENAIKHNMLTKEQPLFIDIKISDDSNFITVKNNLQPKTVSPLSPGIGLVNLSERYRMLNENDITIEKTAIFFCVTVKILKDAGSYN